MAGVCRKLTQGHEGIPFNKGRTDISLSRLFWSILRGLPPVVVSTFWKHFPSSHSDGTWSSIRCSLLACIFALLLFFYFFFGCQAGYYTSDFAAVFHFRLLWHISMAISPSFPCCDRADRQFFLAHSFVFSVFFVLIL